jgi:hypothetical protein
LELFEDEEILEAVQCLRIMANCGMIVNIVQDKNFVKLLGFYQNEELILSARVLLTECFIIIAKNIGLRKLFLRRPFLNAIMLTALKVLAHKDEPPRKVLELGISSIRLLCILCSAKTNRFYIPGETNLAERLRKRAFDSGTFTVVTHLYRSLKGTDREPFV